MDIFLNGVVWGFGIVLIGAILFFILYNLILALINRIRRPKWPATKSWL